MADSGTRPYIKSSNNKYFEFDDPTGPENDPNGTLGINVIANPSTTENDY